MADPGDATVVMQPVPDLTRELPPVPPEPRGFPPGQAPAATAATHAPPSPGVSPVPHGVSLVPLSPGAPTGVLDSLGQAPPVAPEQAGSDAPVDPGPVGGVLARFGAGAQGRLRAIGAGMLAVLLVSTGIWLLVARRHGDEPTGGAVTTTVPVDPSTVRGSATSVQKPDGKITYGVANTLDGNPNTAWNSDGARAGHGPRITLTYRFAAPVDLRSITIRNGYQKVRSSDGVDLWPLNERIRQLQVITDGGQWTWDLQDAREPQTLAQDLGRTRVVRLKITQIYPSTKYRDVAISEITFATRP